MTERMLRSVSFETEHPETNLGVSGGICRHPQGGIPPQGRSEAGAAPAQPAPAGPPAIGKGR